MILRRSEEVAPIRFYLEVVFSQWQTCWSFAFTQMYQDLAKKIVSQNITIIETSFSSVLNWSCWRKPQIFVPFLHNKLWSVRCDSDLLVYVDVVWAGTFVRVLVWMARCSAESHTPRQPGCFLSDFLNIESKQNGQSSLQLLLSPILSESSPDIICILVLQRLFGFYFMAI